MQQKPSSLAGELASQNQLGMLRDTYFENRVFGQMVSLILPLIFLAVLGYILRQMNPSLSWPFLVVLFFALLALLSVIFSTRTLLRKYRQRDTALYLYEHGLIRLQYNDKELAHSDAIRWQDIAIVWHEVKEERQGEQERRLHLYRLQRKDGTLFGGEDYKLVHGKAIGAVRQETLRSFWPETLDRYQRGLPVPFGPLTITQYGIQFEERSIAWAEVSIIDCSGSSTNVVINMHRDKAKAHGWPIQIHIPFGEVPNVHVLRRLLIFARSQQAPPHFVLFGVFRKDVMEALTPIN